MRGGRQGEGEARHKYRLNRLRGVEEGGGRSTRVEKGKRGRKAVRKRGKGRCDEVEDEQVCGCGGGEGEAAVPHSQVCGQLRHVRGARCPCEGGRCLTSSTQQEGGGNDRHHCCPDLHAAAPREGGRRWFRWMPCGVGKIACPLPLLFTYSLFLSLPQ